MYFLKFKPFIPFLIFLNLVFLSTSLQAQKTLEDAKEFVKTHTPEEIASSLNYFIDNDATLKAIEHLIEKSADPNAQDPLRDMNTALHTAVQKHRLDVVTLLLNKRINIHAQNALGKAALHYAVNNIKITNILLKQGADPNARDRFGKTALHWTNNIKVAVLLVEQGTDIHAKDNDGRTALHTSSWIGNLDMVGMLLDKGANSHDRDKNGNTAFHEAINSRDFEVVEFLEAKINTKKTFDLRNHMRKATTKKPKIEKACRKSFL